MENDILTILNYPGSKKRLLNFIDNTIGELLPKGSKVLDIFCGTNAVSYSLKRDYAVAGNDAEIYCYEMARALLVNNKVFNFKCIEDEFLNLFNSNIEKLKSIYPEYLIEQNYIESKNYDGLLAFTKEFLNVWQEGYVDRDSKGAYNLFTTYYSNSYFGLYQSFEIDSLRYAIEKYKGTNTFDILICALYFAMKEVVFSKDGHMAQPLKPESNLRRLMKCREGSILFQFKRKIQDFENSSFVTNSYENKAFNLKLDEIINGNIIDEFDLIYADPPYTDMQYSRYFHLLETLTKYDYPKISLYRGKVSTGLYREFRYQSPLSTRKNAKDQLEDLIVKCASCNKILVFSYAFPVDLINQKSDRYTVNIEELKELFYRHYGVENTLVLSENFQHSNNRNSTAKKVYEYLIVGRPAHE